MQWHEGDINLLSANFYPEAYTATYNLPLCAGRHCSKWPDSSGFRAAWNSPRIEKSSSGSDIHVLANIHSCAREKSFGERLCLLQAAALGPILVSSRATNSSEFPPMLGEIKPDWI